MALLLALCAALAGSSVTGAAEPQRGSAEDRRADGSSPPAEVPPHLRRPDPTGRELAGTVSRLDIDIRRTPLQGPRPQDPLDPWLQDRNRRFRSFPHHVPLDRSMPRLDAEGGLFAGTDLLAVAEGVEALLFRHHTQVGPVRFDPENGSATVAARSGAWNVHVRLWISDTEQEADYALYRLSPERKAEQITPVGDEAYLEADGDLHYRLSNLSAVIEGDAPAAEKIAAAAFVDRAAVDVQREKWRAGRIELRQARTTPRLMSGAALVTAAEFPAFVDHIEEALAERYETVSRSREDLDAGRTTLAAETGELSASVRLERHDSDRRATRVMSEYNLVFPVHVREDRLGPLGDDTYLRVDTALARYRLSNVYMVIRTRGQDREALISLTIAIDEACRSFLRERREPDAVEVRRTPLRTQMWREPPRAIGDRALFTEADFEALIDHAQRALGDPDAGASEPAPTRRDGEVVRGRLPVTAAGRRHTVMLELHATDRAAAEAMRALERREALQEPMERLDPLGDEAYIQPTLGGTYYRLSNVVAWLPSVFSSVRDSEARVAVVAALDEVCREFVRDRLPYAGSE